MLELGKEKRLCFCSFPRIEKLNKCSVCAKYCYEFYSHCWAPIRYVWCSVLSCSLLLFILHIIYKMRSSLFLSMLFVYRNHRRRRRRYSLAHCACCEWFSLKHNVKKICLRFLLNGCLFSFVLVKI